MIGQAISFLVNEESFKFSETQWTLLNKQLLRTGDFVLKIKRKAFFLEVYT